MRITEATLNEFQGACLIVGTGPSMRVFPKDVLNDYDNVIALNQAWRYFGRSGPPYAITVHPELVLQYEDEVARRRLPASTKWFVKKKPPMDGLKLDDPRYYVFDTSPDPQTVVAQPADTLYIGHGVQQTAIDLAVRMGFKTIFLVGCDMTSLGGDHHAHEQHVRFHGLDPGAVYAEYRRFTAKIRRLVEKHHGVHVLTLTPFVGCDHAAEDYVRRCDEQGLNALPAPTDTSAYKRDRTDP